MTIPIFKFPKQPAPTPASIWVSKVEAIKAFRTATQQGLYESKNSFDASFPEDSQIELFVLANWIRAWFVECYKPLPSKAEVKETIGWETWRSNVDGKSTSEPEYRYRKRCSCCDNIFYDEPITKEVYEGAANNPALRYSRESGTWYLTIDSTCNMCS